jgi:SAM-dependent methyltransferase
VKTIGNPREVNEQLIQRIKKIQLMKVSSEDALRSQFLHETSHHASVLDCGLSLRNFAGEVKQKSKIFETLDINEFEDYPDYLVDVCDVDSMKSFRGKYDYVTAFSLLEHCHEPFKAASNLFSALKRGGKLFGSAPFLFPRHGPKDLVYQDFWRFSRDSYALLFPEASNITLYPLRGRVGTALNVLSLRYRFVLETKVSWLATSINRLGASKGHELQSSGYGFIIEREA